MSTLAIMKARIADEIARSDLTTQIAYAIDDAIEAYQQCRFFFNETREVTFTTVANQEFYGKTDQAELGNLVDIDYMTIYYGDQSYEVVQERPNIVEWSSTNGTSTGQPTSYAYYNQQIRLYPVPDTAGHSVRVAGAYKVAAPTTDSEADNPWMTHAKRLIRCRAKFEIYSHVEQDLELAREQAQLMEEAKDQIEAHTTRLIQYNKGRVLPMEF